VDVQNTFNSVSRIVVFQKLQSCITNTLDQLFPFVHWFYTCITNLTFRYLKMELCNISSFITCMIYTLISYIESTTQIYWKMWNPCDNRSFIGSYFICQHIYLCVRHVFNAWYLYVKCMNLWMNELLTVFIINSLHVNCDLPISTISQRLLNARIS